VPEVWQELRGTSPAQLLVQLSIRRVRGMRRSRYHLQGRSRATDSRHRFVDQRWRDRTVAQQQHAVLHAHARGCRRELWNRPRRAVQEADCQTAEGHLAWRRWQPEGEVQEPLRAHARVQHRLRGRCALVEPSPRGCRERLGARTVRGLHARGSVRGMWRCAIEGLIAGCHGERQEHL